MTLRVVVDTNVLIDDLTDFFCAVGERHQIHYLWHPQLQDLKDDMVLELAIAAHANKIVTLQKKHIKDVLHYVIEVISPQDLLSRIGAGG